MDSSKATSQQGRLILAGTTLGNPQDIPARSLEVLKSADLLVFEEDRPARQFLKAAGIHREYWKHSEHRDQGTLAEVAEQLRRGRTVAYMSDQGMPGVADPGPALVELARREGATIEVIPGPCSISTALAACPFSVSQYFFAGFPHRDSQVRQDQMAKWNELKVAIVMMDTPYRRQALLQDAAQAFGAQRQATMAIDISGPDQSFQSDSLAKLSKIATDQKLNFVLVVSAEN